MGGLFSWALEPGHVNFGEGFEANGGRSRCEGTVEDMGTRFEGPLPEEEGFE